jgi:hypothetical protein
MLLTIPTMKLIDCSLISSEQYFSHMCDENKYKKNRNIDWHRKKEDTMDLFLKILTCKWATTTILNKNSKGKYKSKYK